MQEQWRDIPGYKSHYQASNLGRVCSVNRVVRNPHSGPMRLKGRVMRLNTSAKDGYLRVSLRKEGVSKTFRVHKLVALAWLGPCPPGQQVRHGPNGKLDNSISNLCYGTAIEDARDKVRDGTLFGGNVKGVRRSDGVEFITLADAGRESNCRSSSICACCKGDRYKTGGYGWEYIKESSKRR